MFAFASVAVHVAFVFYDSVIDFLHLTWAPPLGIGSKVALSLDGFGEAEQQVFALSAWSGLFVNVLTVEYCIHHYYAEVRAETRAV